ncbi:Clavaminate synthase-like protein [Rhodofomes roseus]|uniref:Clavaminate synthase-like protein n=1 Tax=Rhodofomes roseus TaxID=34475 RepID=A0ABQ8KVC0_9APHY|nr:Clavaminate synthase-like protein [Rhodofomes roseus]KAH9843017.1 Clavaminate synthase-like protein [Rhodofomes roseus]
MMSDAWAQSLVRELLFRLRDDRLAFQNAVSPQADAIRVALGSLESASWDEHTSSQLDVVIHWAYEEMRASPRADALVLRMLYTDACILRSLGDVLQLGSTQNQVLTMSCVSRLDHAIVIAGAPGERRLDIILDLILEVQQRALGFVASSCDLEHHLDEVRVLSTTASRALASAPHQVPRLDSPPSMLAFVRQYSQRPFVIPRYITDWPALNEHPWSSLDYLQSMAGPGRVVPVEIGDDYRDDDWTQKMLLWDDFLDALDPRKQSTREKRKLYLAQHNLFLQFPKLRNDIIIPDYAYASLPAPKAFSGYVPPANEEQLVLNVWLGPSDMTSPAHTDPFFNLYAQVVGQKTVWLAPPQATPAMYPYPPPSGNASDRTHNPAANTTNPCMSNTSRVDVFAPRGSQDEMPLFWEEAVPHAMSVTLEPGDLLFFPPGWWHAMRSENTSFSVSMWF